MSEKFAKGIKIGEEKAEEKAVQEQKIEEYETSEEETNALILENEADFIQGLIEAANFSESEEETQRIEIIRSGKLLFAFKIRPLGSEEYEKCRKKHTKYVRNKRLGIKTPEDTDKTKYQSEIIYMATVKEDRDKLWDNRQVWKALNEKKDRIMNGLDVIEYALKAGEKDKILEAIDKLSGYENDLEEVAKN